MLYLQKCRSGKLINFGIIYKFNENLRTFPFLYEAQWNASFLQPPSFIPASISGEKIANAKIIHSFPDSRKQEHRPWCYRCQALSTMTKDLSSLQLPHFVPHSSLEPQFLSLAHFFFFYSEKLHQLHPQTKSDQLLFTGFCPCKSSHTNTKRSPNLFGIPYAFFKTKQNKQSTLCSHGNLLSLTQQTESDPQFHWKLITFPSGLINMELSTLGNIAL